MIWRTIPIILFLSAGGFVGTVGITQPDVSLDLHQSPAQESVYSEVHIEGARPDTIVQHLGAATLTHPRTGDIQFVLEQDLTPVVTEVGWYDENGNLVEENPREYDLTLYDRPGTGRLTVATTFVGGFILTEQGDLEIEGSWTLDGLILRLGGAPPDIATIEATDTFAPEDGPSQTSPTRPDDGNWPTSHNHGPGDCANAMSRFRVLQGLGIDLAPTCPQIEELLPDVPVGDDQETLLNSNIVIGAAKSAPDVIRVKVFHENRASRASSDCNYANSRIFEEETTATLECSLLSTTRHEQGTDDGTDDWEDFLDDYYAGRYSYRSNAQNYNAERFVAFLVDEAYFEWGGQTATGLGNDCGSPTWSTSSRYRACGHMAVFYNQNAYFVHSAAYREGQTFAHELIHTLNVQGTGHNGHDDSVAHKNYNGKEGCWGWGNDFISHNVFFYTADGNKCDHRHYWLSATDGVQGEINANAAIHYSYYSP